MQHWQDSGVRELFTFVMSHITLQEKNTERQTPLMAMINESTLLATLPRIKK